MIRVLTGMPAGVVGVEAGGKLTAEDYTKVLAPALILAVASIVGVLVGASFVATISQQATKGVLGVILILATVRMATAELDTKE